MYYVQKKSLELKRFTTKKVSDFPVPSRDVTNWLVTSQLGTGKSLSILYCTVQPLRAGAKPQNLECLMTSIVLPGTEQ
jgi:hypothetical protein